MNFIFIDFYHINLAKLYFTQGVLMFMSLLSMTFYKRVICHFLISGHSHMMPDRVVSHIKKSFGTNDLFLPTEMIEKMSNIKTVKGEFIDHNDPMRNIYSGWEKVLKDQFIPIPSIDNGYTKNHFFEFCDGQVSIRHIVGSEIKYVHNYVLNSSLNTIRKRILQSIIGNVSLSKATIDDIILPRHPISEFPQSKISSLTEKYFSIPEDKLYYYPSVTNNPDPETNNLMEKSNTRARETVNMIRKKRGVDNDPTLNNKGGRKKTVAPATPFSQSILPFLKLTPLPLNNGNHDDTSKPMIDNFILEQR